MYVTIKIILSFSGYCPSLTIIWIIDSIENHSNCTDFWYSYDSNNFSKAIKYFRITRKKYQNTLFSQVFIFSYVI